MLLAPRLRPPAADPLCVSVPTVLLAPTVRVPVVVMSAVPAPLKPKLALTKPPLAASVPALANALFKMSLPVAVACIKPLAAFCMPPVMSAVNAVDWLAVIVPWFTKAICVPAPSWPEPCNVCPTPKVS